MLQSTRDEESWQAKASPIPGFENMLSSLSSVRIDLVGFRPMTSLLITFGLFPHESYVPCQRTFQNPPKSSRKDERSRHPRNHYLNVTPARRLSCKPLRSASVSQV